MLGKRCFLERFVSSFKRAPAKRFEEKLQKLIVTPHLHGIHHSVKQNEMDSNWSSGLTAWDFLHGTFAAMCRRVK
jgi:sterol desaturase/sphingolipid hydroxylase (fatty acid hydroxylase superfamily)